MATDLKANNDEVDEVQDGVSAEQSEQQIGQINASLETAGIRSKRSVLKRRIKTT
jgi:hypothetical protein